VATYLNSYKFIVVTVIVILIATYAKASTYLDVGDEVYNTLLRLEAEGVIKTGLLSAKPLSRKEIIRLTLEAEENSEGKSPFVRNQIQALKKKFADEIDGTIYLKPLDKVSMGYLHSDSEPSDLIFNNDGDDYGMDNNFRFGISSRAELGCFSLFVNPELRYSESDTDLTMKKVYGVFDFLGLELEIGTDSQWWGPGYHGAILLSNNPEPLPLIKLTNSRPVLLPWVLKYLGLFKFTAFVTRLEEDRVVPEPYFWGMRLNFKPSPYFEVGVHRTAMLGGEGRPEDLSTWWDSFTGKGENDLDGPGDQKGGYDIKLTLPFKLQPMQLYVEADGEDEAGGLPSRWAYLSGVYLPRILNFERIEFRAEYADNHVSGHPNYWYNHFAYKSGYTFEGRIIGHHMDTDSEDSFVEVSYLIPERDGRITVSYDREEHNLSEDVNEEKKEIYMTADIGLTESMKIKASYGYGKFKNFNNISGNDENINIFSVQITYNF